MADWDMFLSLMKDEVIDKGIQEEAQSKLKSVYELLSKMVNGVTYKNEGQSSEVVAPAQAPA